MGLPGLAQHFYKKYQWDGGPEQHRHFLDVVSGILNVVEREDRSGNLNKPGVWSWCRLKSGKEWTLEKWVTVNTVSPYRRAAGLIKKFVVALE
jgi:hypothetical protein